MKVLVFYCLVFFSKKYVRLGFQKAKLSASRKDLAYEPSRALQVRLGFQKAKLSASRKDLAYKPSRALQGFLGLFNQYQGKSGLEDADVFSASSS